MEPAGSEGGGLGDRRRPAAGAAAGLSWPFYLGLAGVAAQFAWQVASLDIDDPAGCLTRFRSNRYSGWILLAGILAAGALA